MRERREARRTAAILAQWGADAESTRGWQQDAGLPAWASEQTRYLPLYPLLTRGQEQRARYATRRWGRP